uniref:Uncharacterized protein n=1 Tax=Aegilops tauschii subsp. strangulata TaxID=200361 RepID=A0A453SQK9_AEGTS
IKHHIQGNINNNLKKHHMQHHHNPSPCQIMDIPSIVVRRCPCIPPSKAAALASRIPRPTVPLPDTKATNHRGTGPKGTSFHIPGNPYPTSMTGTRGRPTTSENPRPDPSDLDENKHRRHPGREDTFFPHPHELWALVVQP